MNTPEELNRLLSECCEQLVDCSVIIKELPLEPAKKNIYRVGKARGDFRNKVTAVQNSPHLKPGKWNEPPSEQDFAEMYEEALRQADEHLQAGNPAKAIETFESYIFIGPIEKYKNMARDEIEKLRSKYGV